jgi:hypothetical protein
MNWLEKFGLVERDGSMDVFAPMDVVSSIDEVEVDASIDSVTNIVANIYEQNDLSDKSNSIYNIQEFIATLPEEMTTAKKQSTVAGILAVFHKSVEDLIVDANNRVGVLNAAKEKIVGERTNEIATAKADIEKFKQSIESATLKIKAAEEIIDATNKSVDHEVKVINDLVEFCNGMEGK